MRRWIVLGSFALSAAVFGSTAGYFVRLDMPDLRSLEDYVPPEMTRILARDGSEIASFATEKRIVLRDADIPDSFRHALIASEDSRFADHAGIDPIGGLRALWSDLRRRRFAEGASTLTMQLAGNLFLDRSKRTVRRKAQEVFLAMEIERNFTKQEILRMYANQVYFGHGLHGLEAASRYYFGKTARALTTGESATLVGLLPRPASYSPVRNLSRATERRDLVLRRMVDEGYLAAREADRLVAEPIVLSRREESDALAPHFVEGVRRALHESYGSGSLYRGGLVVETTLDPRLQAFANEAVERGLRRFDERKGGRPEVALIALDPTSGKVLAHVGGRDYAHSEYDRATQARRQTGSLFKPFVYATALSRGWTLADTLVDEPTVFLDPRRPVPYQPENFSRRYYETITLRTALEKSANIATVKLLEQVGCDPVIETARRLGVRSRLRPYPSLALGAFELTLLEVTSAYGAFANQGLLMEPHWIEEARDRSGRTLHRARPRVTEAVSPQVAYLMNRALTGVIRRGTGHAAGEVLSHTLAGKTGTTDDYTDAWFVGYSPHLAVGVWVGHDVPRSLGEAETGGRAALPIWIEFMRRALLGAADEAFAVPPGITTVPIDPRTGERPSLEAGCTEYRAEVFIEGTEPSEICSTGLHRKLSLPYPFQPFPLDADGALMIPRDRLEPLLTQEEDVMLDAASGMLLLIGREGVTPIPVSVLSPNDEDDRRLPDTLREEAEGWVGTDGRAARVVWFGARPRPRAELRLAR